MSEEKEINDYEEDAIKSFIGFTKNKPTDPADGKWTTKAISDKELTELLNENWDVTIEGIPISEDIKMMSGWNDPEKVVIHIEKKISKIQKAYNNVSTNEMKEALEKAFSQYRSLWKNVSTEYAIGLKSPPELSNKKIKSNSDLIENRRFEGLKAAGFAEENNTDEYPEIPYLFKKPLGLAHAIHEHYNDYENINDFWKDYIIRTSKANEKNTGRKYTPLKDSASLLNAGRSRKRDDGSLILHSNLTSSDINTLKPFFK